MYEPNIFKETRKEPMLDLVASQPFGTIVSMGKDGLTADHVPIVYKEGQDVDHLEGHFSIANPIYKNHLHPLEVLVIFQGPQSYISPSWYPSKKTHNRAVPTWNYAVVHITGKLRFIHENDWLLRHLNELTDTHEKDRPDPWTVDDAPAEYIEKQLRGIVGFEIAMEKLSGKWKMSQNKTEADSLGVISGLESTDQPEAAKVAHSIAEQRRR